VKFIVLGSGSSVPHPKRSSSAYWLETSGGSILLEFAPSAIHRMAQENLDWANLDAIWISHFHLDHSGGLAPFLFGTKYAPETQNRTKPLKIFGPKGLRKLIESFDRAYDYGLLDQPFPVEVIEIEPLEKFKILPDVVAVAISTVHTEESCAIRIMEKSDKSVVFTSDTGFSKDLSALAKNADLFVLECSFVKNKPVEKHLELADAICLIRRANPKRALLTHFYPEWDEVDFAEDIENISPNIEIIEAKDGLQIEI
jgi:ribonuclease BN (tRNA processing enzyme)